MCFSPSTKSNDLSSEPTIKQHGNTREHLFFTLLIAEASQAVNRRRKQSDIRSLTGSYHTKTTAWISDSILALRNPGWLPEHVWDKQEASLRWLGETHLRPGPAPSDWVRSRFLSAGVSIKQHRKTLRTLMNKAVRTNAPHSSAVVHFHFWSVIIKRIQASSEINNRQP